MAKSQTSSTRDPYNDPVEKPLPPLIPKPSNSSLAGSSKTSNQKTWREKKKYQVWINSGTKVKKTIASPLSVALTARLRKICPRSRALTVTRKGITRGTALSPEKTYQKTSIGLGNFRSDD